MTRPDLNPGLNYSTEGRPHAHDAAKGHTPIRPIAIGRNIWLFAGSKRGGNVAAVLYTLIEFCKLADVDAPGYLANVLVRVATHHASRIGEVLPANWAKHFAATTIA
jgi:hypothetical protein